MNRTQRKRIYAMKADGVTNTVCIQAIVSTIISNYKKRNKTTIMTDLCWQKIVSELVIEVERFYLNFGN